MIDQLRGRDGEADLLLPSSQSFISQPIFCVPSPKRMSTISYVGIIKNFLLCCMNEKSRRKQRKHTSNIGNIRTAEGEKDVSVYFGYGENEHNEKGECKDPSNEE